MEINEKTAELAGIIIGDGNLHKKNNLITIVGSLEDLDYYKKRVIPLFKEIFSKEPKLRKRNDRNAYYLTLYSKEATDFLVNKVGLIRGSKANATVPKAILENKELVAAFLRGLFDTDGCIKFSKQVKKINYYPRVQIALRDSSLVHGLGQLFKYIGFPYGTWKDYRYSGVIFYQISGKENTDKWFKIISPKNPVHISKYEFWKKFGYYIPKSSLEFRKKKLSVF